MFQDFIKMYYNDIIWLICSHFPRFSLATILALKECDLNHSWTTIIAYSPFFSSVAHVWVPGAKTTVPMSVSVRILSFNAIHSVVKNMFHKGPVAANGPVRNGIFYFWIFFNVDGHEKIII
jgi:hypothetical protein